MKKPCDLCHRPATHHSVEIVNGTKIEKHLCDKCAAEQGLAVGGSHLPLPELLTNFVKQHAQGTHGSEGAGSASIGGQVRKQAILKCPECGMKFAEFRELSLLGCPHCYAAFENELIPMLERAHEGGGHHVGKVPKRAGRNEARQLQVARMRQKLEEAVLGEDYELAARIRDDIQSLEQESTQEAD